MGRPSKYTPQTIGKVLGSLQAGLSVESACDHAGIHPDIHYQWVKDYDEYSEKVTAARLYGKLLASKQVTDILQDVTREKPSIQRPHEQQSPDGILRSMRNRYMAVKVCWLLK